MNDLKAYPFCGGPSKIEDLRTIWRVKCQGCGALVLGDRFDEPGNEEDEAKIDLVHFEKTAVDRWNRREP